MDPQLELGAAETRIEVSGQSSEMLVKDSPLRGGNFQPREVRDLPLISSNPLSLARMLPGVTEASGSQVWSNVRESWRGFPINGQRPRGEQLHAGWNREQLSLSLGRGSGICHR